MNKKLYKLMNWPEIEEIIYADGDNPHRILGAHKVGNHLLIQAFFPGAEQVQIHFGRGKESYPMELADEDGFFAALVPGNLEGERYSYHVEFEDGHIEDSYDPYNFPPLTDREDIIQFNAGIHYHIYKKFGAHPMTRDGILGVNFVVWAPSAARVSVIGAFNAYDGRRHQMMRMDQSGVFELFIPGLKEGTVYQYELRGRDGTTVRKSDPFAFAVTDAYGSESVVCAEEEKFEWTDETFLRTRKKESYSRRPFSICELSLDSFAAAYAKEGQAYTYREMAADLIPYLKTHGFDAVELQPVMEHGVNPFEVTSFYAVKGAYGTRADFMAFVNALHEAQIVCILEWTPTFFMETAAGLSFFDTQPLYEYTDVTKMRQVKSGYLVFDYGRKQVCNYLLSNALYFATQFHIDGLRATDISKAIYLDYDRGFTEWHPNIYGGNENLEAIDFFRQLNTTMKKFDKGFLMITKETACRENVTGDVDEGGLGFTYKWNNGWSRDFLQYLRNDPLYRAPHHGELTFSLIYAYAEKYILAFAHEDAEQGYTSIVENMPGSDKERFANARLALSCLFLYPGKKMLFLNPDSEGTAQDKLLLTLVSALNSLYHTHPALYERDEEEQGFQWINANMAEECVLTFARLSAKEKDTLIAVVNLSGIAQELTFGVPFDGKYKVIFSSEEERFGGEVKLSQEYIAAIRKDVDGREYALKYTVPALSVTLFDYTAYTMKERAIRKIKEETEYQRELEMEREAQALIEAHRLEEERLLKELKEKHDKELEEQTKAIKEKYERIEAEQIKKASKK